MKGSLEIKWQYARVLSKNNLYIAGNKTHGYKPEVQAEVDGIVYLLPSKFRGYTWTDSRIKVDIFVYRPRTNIDAHNWVDGIADAVEKAIGINDSNFDVIPHCIDDKENPRIVIEVSQDEPE